MRGASAVLLFCPFKSIGDVRSESGRLEKFRLRQPHMRSDKNNDPHISAALKAAVPPENKKPTSTCRRTIKISRYKMHRKRCTSLKIYWDSATTFVDSPMAIDHRPTSKSCLPYRFGEDCLQCGRCLPARAPSSASQPLSTLVSFYNIFLLCATLLCVFLTKNIVYLIPLFSAGPLRDILQL